MRTEEMSRKAGKKFDNLPPKSTNVYFLGRSTFIFLLYLFSLQIKTYLGEYFSFSM